MKAYTSIKERVFGIGALAIVAAISAWCIGELTVSVAQTDFRLATDGHYHLYQDGAFTPDAGAVTAQDPLLVHNTLVYGVANGDRAPHYFAVNVCTGKLISTTSDSEFASQLDSLQVPAANRDFSTGKSLAELSQTLEVSCG